MKCTDWFYATNIILYIDCDETVYKAQPVMKTCMAYPQKQSCHLQYHCNFVIKERSNQINVKNKNQI